MPSISVVIITFNEEQNIARCLASVQKVADDIVVVDSFSTDSTERICKEHDVRFISHKFEGHIQQKNWALSQAKYPHVLSLDADEALSEELIQSVLLVKGDWKGDAYEMNRLTNYCGSWVHHCGWYPDTKLRLWNIEKGNWGGINPHDKVIMQKKSKVRKLKGDILHYSYYTREGHYKQVDYFTDILAKEKFERGKKAPLVLLVLSPVVRFIRDYIFKLGFLDGAVGFTVCRISAYSTYLKYKKLRALYMQ